MPTLTSPPNRKAFELQLQAKYQELDQLFSTSSRLVDGTIFSIERSLVELYGDKQGAIDLEINRYGRCRLILDRGLFVAMGPKRTPLRLAPARLKKRAIGAIPQLCDQLRRSDDSSK